jgi:hypothetical protein
MRKSTNIEFKLSATNETVEAFIIKFSQRASCSNYLTLDRSQLTSLSKANQCLCSYIVRNHSSFAHKPALRNSSRAAGIGETVDNVQLLLQLAHVVAWSGEDKGRDP